MGGKLPQERGQNQHIGQRRLEKIKTMQGVEENYFVFLRHKLSMQCRLTLNSPCYVASNSRSSCLKSPECWDCRWALPWPNIRRYQ
jgi:hypothetical protein